MQSNIILSSNYIDYYNEIKEIEEKNFNILNDNFIGSFYLLTCNKKLIGYIYYTFNIDFYEILSVYIKEEYRGFGYSKILFSKFDKDIFLEVNANNKIAINLYEKLGFKMYYKREKYYNNKEDALLYKREYK